jgi:hypothetical protein
MVLIPKENMAGELKEPGDTDGNEQSRHRRFKEADSPAARPHFHFG